MFCKVILHLLIQLNFKTPYELCIVNLNSQICNVGLNKVYKPHSSTSILLIVSTTLNYFGEPFSSTFAMFTIVRQVIVTFSLLFF